MSKESLLSKLKLGYEYNQTYPEIKKMLQELHGINKSKLVTIRKLARQGIPIKDLAEKHDMTIQKITAIVRKK